MQGIIEYFEKEYPDLHIRDVIECNEPMSLNELSKEYCKSQLVEMPTDEEIYYEGCGYVRNIKQPNRQPIITLRRAFKAGAEFVKKSVCY